MFLADEFLAKSEPLNVSESDEVSFKFEHEIITSNIKQVESNPNNFFIVFLLQSGSISRPYNNWLYRSGLDPLSATNLCYVIFTFVPADITVRTCVDVASPERSFKFSFTVIVLFKATFVEVVDFEVCEEIAFLLPS